MYYQKETLLNFKICEHTKEHFVIQSVEPRSVASSAILNGGIIETTTVFNRFITKDFADDPHYRLTPEEMLALYSKNNFHDEKAVGLLTAAPYYTYAFCGAEKDGIVVEAHITSGTSNSRRAGDPADVHTFEETEYRAGTINIIIATNASLEPQTLLEALMIVTESKVAIMEERGVTSNKSGMMSTGTGTDTVAVINGTGRRIKYCGKHVLFGEMLAQVVKRALNQSLQQYDDNNVANRFF
ncbi:MAG: adenosylcobinamide amidohydrolase [Clostridia bacterium]|nr:adenosylcobinamide amidohydrolase [Clostridia bacterium]